MDTRELIMIIDDNPADLEQLISSLSDNFITEVYQCVDQIFVKKIHNGEMPVLILLSHSKCTSTCFEIFKTMRLNPVTSTIPIIFIKETDCYNEENLLQLGVTDFITRPINTKLATLRINNYLRLNDNVDGLHFEYKQLLAAISSILIGLDHEDRIILWNRSAERFFQLRWNEVQNKTLSQLNIHWDKEPVYKSIKKCRESMHVIRTDDIMYTRTDGSPGFIGFSMNPINHKGSDNLSVLIVGADITGKKDMEKKLLHAQKMESIGQLSAGIAHEINTPIQFVSDNISFLSSSFTEMNTLIDNIKKQIEAVDENSQCKELVNKLLNAIKLADIDYLLEEIPSAIAQSKEGVSRVSKIVSAMKDFSHGSDEKMKSDLNRAIESTIIVAQSQWKNVATVETQFDTDLPLVPCLLSEVNQVVLNIIINAAHAIADVIADNPGSLGVITISTKRTENSAVIRISDTGPGIPENIRSRVFDPFFTTKGVGKGTGQGLSIAHDVITKKHNGELSVESQLGVGSTFIITLPLSLE